MAEMTPIVDEAIRQLIVVEGVSWKTAAAQYGLTLAETRAAYDRADAVAQARRGSNAEAWRHSLAHVYLDIAAKAQEAFEKSCEKSVKKSKKDGPKGTTYETTIEHRVGDPRFLNTRIAAIAEIGRIYVPDLPKEININERSEHDITFRLENMTDEELDQAAMIAKMEQDGVLLIDANDFKVIESKPLESDQKNEDDSGLCDRLPGSEEDNPNVRGV